MARVGKLDRCIGEKKTCCAATAALLTGVVKPKAIHVLDKYRMSGKCGVMVLCETRMILAS
jgi:hypothetical protein